MNTISSLELIEAQNEKRSSLFKQTDRGLSRESLSIDSKQEGDLIMNNDVPQIERESA